MRKLTLSLLTLSLGVALLPLAQAATTPAQEHLLEQVRLGEASNREDLVRQSLYRLELIDPNNPELIAARMRYLLRQGDAAGAQKELERLTKLAPDSPELKASRNEMKSNTGEGRQALQQARLLGVAGKVDEAIAAYEKLYGGVPDDVDVAIEYWTLVARLPARHSEGVSQLKKLNASAPGNVSLLTSLAKQMFADNKPQEGFAYLAEMARSASGRGIAADMWFSEVKSMPVSKASVQALQQFLLQFPTGSVAANARVLLDQQQAQLQDPTFRARSEGLAAVKSGNTTQAVADLQKAVQADSRDSDAVGALGQAYSQRGDRARAVAQLSKAIAMDPDSPNRGKWDSLLQTNRYWLLIKQGDNALKAGQLSQAQNYYAQAQRVDRTDSHDDWLKRGIRSDAADLYRQQDLNVTLEHDFWGSSGTGGYSDLKAHTTMLQVDAPLADGRMFFRTDLVNMDAGSFSTHSDGSYSPSWGTCGEIACTSGSKNQTDSGASVAIGWKNDTWSGDIGTTPMGFNVVDVVGGLSYSSDVGPVGYTVNVHRRPISSSLLSFGGQKDSSSHTGATWGGVRADGGGLSLSYDRGEAHGIWSSLGADSLTGKNVADNWRVRWMTGYYYKVINENNRRVTVGLNNMIWHYDKDLSGYTLGQGGYYSPQEYLSFAVPVTWRQRTENWSWELGGSVSWSHSRTQTQARYPLLNLIPSDYRQRASELTEEGSSSHGFGYTARALVERRVTSNWFVGAAVDIQQAKDYTPSHALLYVRYSAAGWQGDLDMPPQPLVPYADW
ncbi:BCSC C-terminal domain-containing protein [Klebsiella pneumoniae]|nr:tetratricopeptide repeat protein [Klebsiella pneumoniae]